MRACVVRVRARDGWDGSRVRVRVRVVMVMMMMDIANIRVDRSMGDSAATVWMDDDDGEDN